MGHLFVPAALVLWVGVAVVRLWATPAPAPTPFRAVKVESAKPRPAESSGKSVPEAERPQVRVHGEG